MLRKDIKCERLFNSDTFDGESNTPLPPKTVRNDSLPVFFWHHISSFRVPALWRITTLITAKFPWDLSTWTIPEVYISE